MPLGFEQFQRRHPLRLRGVPQPQEGAAGEEAGHERRRRRRLRPDLKSNAEALDVIVEAIGKAGYEPGKQVFIALDPAATEFYDAETRSYYDRRQGDRRGRAWSICYAELGRQVSDLLDRRRLRRRRLGRLEAADRAARRQDPTGRRRPVRHQHQAAAARHRRGHRQQHPHQGQPDRHADRDDRGHRAGPAQRLHQRHQPPQRRDRRRDDRRPGRGPGHRPDQDRLGLADRPHGQVQPTAADRRETRRRRPLRRPAVPEEVGIHHGGHRGTEKKRNASSQISSPCSRCTPW